MALGAIVLALTGFSDLSAAASSCTYDPGTKTEIAALDPGGSAELEVGASGEIRFGAPPSPCGAATTGNTDTILVTGAAGSTERLVLDQFAGPLAPGATPEASGLSEIEVSVELGDSSDEVVVQGSPDQEPLAVGTKGVAFNDDSDVDITFSPLPASIELVEAGGGPHVLSARGGFGSGKVFPGPVTLRAGNLGGFLTGERFRGQAVRWQRRGPGPRVRRRRRDRRRRGERQAEGRRRKRLALWRPRCRHLLG